MLVAGEPLGERPRLPAPVVVQRPVGVTLQPALGVPVGLAVANEQQRRSSPTRLASRGSRPARHASASSPARPAASASRRRGCSPPKARRSSRRGRRGDAPGVGEALHVAADLARAGEPERLVRETEAQLGRVDVLVNNVGVAYQRTFEEVTDEQWDELWQLNVMSYVRAIRAVLPGMKERQAGVIVNVSSTAGKRPSASMPDYSVTKAAVLSLSRLVADVYAKDGHPLQRGHARARPRRRRGSARAVSPTSRRRAAARRATRCSPRSAAGARSAASPSRRRSPPSSRFSARSARAT